MIQVNNQGKQLDIEILVLIILLLGNIPLYIFGGWSVM